MEQLIFHRSNFVFITIFIFASVQYFTNGLISKVGSITLLMLSYVYIFKNRGSVPISEILSMNTSKYPLRKNYFRAFFLLLLLMSAIFVFENKLSFTIMILLAFAEIMKAIVTTQEKELALDSATTVKKYFFKNIIFLSVIILLQLVHPGIKEFELIYACLVWIAVDFLILKKTTHFRSRSQIMRQGGIFLSLYFIMTIFILLV